MNFINGKAFFCSFVFDNHNITNIKFAKNLSSML